MRVCLELQVQFVLTFLPMIERSPAPRCRLEELAASAHRESEGRNGQRVSDGIDRSVDAEPEGPRGQEVAKEGRLDDE